MTRSDETQFSDTIEMGEKELRIQEPREDERRCETCQIRIRVMMYIWCEGGGPISDSDIVNAATGEQRTERPNVSVCPQRNTAIALLLHRTVTERSGYRLTLCSHYDLVDIRLRSSRSAGSPSTTFQSSIYLVAYDGTLCPY